MRTLIVAMGIALSGCYVSVAAEDPTRGEQLASLVAPFVDNQTLLIVHLDLMAFDAVETVDWLAERFELAEEQRDALQAQAVLARVITQTLPADGHVDVFVIVSLADMGRLPAFVVLPPAPRGAAAAIAVEVRRELEKSLARRIQTARVGEALVVASPETIERLGRDKPVARPEVAAALSAAGPSALRLAFIPSAELRGFVATILPRLPKEFGGAQMNAFTDGAEWVAAGVQLPPDRLTVNAVVQSSDATAADALRKELSTLYQSVGPQDSGSSRDEFAESTARLLPTVDGDRLTLHLVDDEGDLDALVAVLMPLARTVAKISGP